MQKKEITLADEQLRDEEQVCIYEAPRVEDYGTLVDLTAGFKDSLGPDQLFRRSLFRSDNQR